MMFRGPQFLGSIRFFFLYLNQDTPSVAIIPFSGCTIVIWSLFLCVCCLVPWYS